MGKKPQQYADIPFQSFSKSERLGHIVDWSVSAADSARNNNYGARRRGFDTDGAGVYSYRNQEDEASFSLVDGGKAPSKSRSGGLNVGRGLLNNNRSTQRTAGARSTQRGLQAGGRNGVRGMATGRKGGRGGWGGGRDWNREQKTKEPSVKIGDKWTNLEDIDFSRLQKLRLDVETEDVETLYVMHFCVNACQAEIASWNMKIDYNVVSCMNMIEPMIVLIRRMKKHYSIWKDYTTVQVLLKTQ